MDIVENRKPKLTQFSFKVAEKASSDGATNKQCLIDDQKDTKTTITKLSTDLVDIPKPTLSRVSIAEYSHSSLNDGATIAPRIFTKMLRPVLPAGRCSSVDKMGQASPGDETDQSVLFGSETEDIRPDPVGPVGPYITFDQVQPVADGPVGPYITLSPVGSDGKHSRVIPISLWLMAQWARCLHSAWLAQEGHYHIIDLISLWLMAQWACRLHSAQWAQEGRYPSVDLISRWLMARLARPMNLA